MALTGGWGQKLAERFGRFLASVQDHLAEPYIEPYPEPEDDGTVTVAVAYNEPGMRWVFRALIEVAEEECDLPDCDEPVEAVLIMVDSDEPSIQTAVRICAEHLNDACQAGSNVYISKAQWN